jgi:putative sterol carrier protein
VPKYLTQEWLDVAREQAADQPSRPGLSATLQYVVSGGPEGEIRHYSVIEDGKLRDAQLGAADDPDLTFTLSYDDSVLIQRGELDANAAFMQGRLKAVGDMTKLMQLMPLTMSDEYKALQEKLRSITDY